MSMNVLLIYSERFVSKMATMFGLQDIVMFGSAAITMTRPMLRIVLLL